MIRRNLIPLVAVTALALPGVATAKPVAHAAKNCKLSSAENGGTNPSSLGPSYVTQGKFSASGVACGKAKKVAKAYYGKCKGKTSSCRKTVKGYSCSQKLLGPAGVATYDATATCKSGSKKVSFQFTSDR